jgi:glycosyltransferase involved in cell wall biosynthesis/GT2 family glycosyltransferase
MNVSIIINTLNRDSWLKKVLDTLMYQTYNDFEIVVVNGPSTDKTDEVLQAYKDIIKIEKCEMPNISISRNIGIKAAAGEIVVFIDDDAIPTDKYWIEHYVKAFQSNPKLGCAGGKVYNSFNNMEFDSGAVNIWGHPFCFFYEIDYSDPDIIYKYVPGGNGAFLKKALVQIGGFDEYFEYYLDDSDVALRIFRAGYEVNNNLYAHVFHKNAKTWDKKSRVFLNWYAFGKNQTYFGYKNSEGLYDIETRKRNILKESSSFKKRFKQFLSDKYITKNEYNKFIELLESGVKQGEYDGLNSKRRLRFDLNSGAGFKKINKQKTQKQLNVIYLLPDSPKLNGGSGKHTKELAYGLFKLGVNIHIVFCGSENIDYMEDGINYYSISPPLFFLSEAEPYALCKHVLRLSYGVYKKVRMLTRMFNIDIIETPLWDFNGLICAEFLNIPVVTRLQTPMKIVNNVHNIKETGDRLLLYEFEKRLINKSSGVIAISDCITNTINDLYNIKFCDKLYKNYLGIEDIEFEPVNRGDDKITIFFIGRLERRKGIANLFKVIPDILSKYNNVEFRFAGADTYDNILGTTFQKYFHRKRKYKHLLKNIFFLGEISDEQKEYELQSCDIFVSPSLYESFGIIFIEAMRHKKPVIGCNAGGMPEIIVNNETGILCEPDNCLDLKKALLRLIENKSLRESMGQSGYERFKKMFTREIMAKGILDIYKKVIENYHGTAVFL